MHDVIIVGARVAGSATALLLARAGLKVLVVDRATFPSDTLSTHQVQVPGVARLARWGVLDPIMAAGMRGGRLADERRPGDDLPGVAQRPVRRVPRRPGGQLPAHTRCRRDGGA